MRKLIPFVILLLVCVSSYAVNLTVYSISIDQPEALPFAEVSISINGSSWETCTDGNGKYSFDYSGPTEIQWISYVIKGGWYWVDPSDGYVTTSVSVTVHRHYLDCDGE
jgi:hypothetical protein